MQWHIAKIEAILLRLNTSLRGLTEREAKARLAVHGPNSLPAPKRELFVFIFLRQFQSSIIYVLLIAAAIVYMLGEGADALIIFAVLLINALIGAIQEGKAQSTLLALEKFIATNATVIRDGVEKVISDEHVASGDILVLREGDKVPADGRLTETSNFAVDESALTGESDLIVKDSESAVAENAENADKKNMVFRGTLVVRGRARAVVVAVGTSTVVGSISRELSKIDTEMPLKANIRSLSRIIIIVVSSVSAVLFFLGILKDFSAREMFKTVVAVSVSAIPEGLPVVVTLILATGVRRMSRKNALVRRLQAVEALGQAKIIALDKTGTITLNQMMVEKFYADGEIYNVEGKGYEPFGEIHGGKVSTPTRESAYSFAVRVAAFIASSSVAYNEEKRVWERLFGDPTEAALLVFAAKAGCDRDELLRDNPLIEEIPFDSGNRFHASLNSVNGKPFLSVSGAPETILSASRYLKFKGESKRIDKKTREDLEEKILNFSKQGLRVIALAYNAYPPALIHSRELPPLTLIALLGMSDSLREGVAESVRIAEDSRVKVVMITGDHAETAKAIARRAGIYSDGDRVLTGTEMDNMKRKDFMSALGETTVFARISPEDKLKIIQGYRERGDVVAMTGDGVNDALSLAAADLGVAMGNVGTEVAKEAGDIVLLDDNFRSIVSAMEEGRNIYATLKKVILYLFSTSAGEVLTITAAILLGLPLPIVASQIIWLNFVTDSFLIAALAVEPRESLRRSFVKYESLLDNRAIRRLIVQSLTMMVGTLILFTLFYDRGYVVASTAALTVLAVFQWFNAWNCRTESGNLGKIFSLKNPFLILATLLVVALQFAAVYYPPLQNILHTTALGVYDWILIVTFAFTIVITDVIWKRSSRSERETKIVHLDVQRPSEIFGV